MEKISDFNFFMPTKVIFGKGQLNNIAQEVAPYGSKVLIVTYKNNEWTHTLQENIGRMLSKSGINYVGFVEVGPEPDPATIDSLYAKLKIKDIDVVIGLGGGSVLDASKGLAVLIKKGGKVWDYVGRGKVNEEVVPVIALPTTAGTGSEVTPYAIFKNSDINRKAGIVSNYIFPKVAILDPQLTVSCPKGVTAASGIDAFAHALESYTSPTRNPTSMAISRKAVELIGRNLSKAVHEGNDIDARSAMLLGSNLGGIAIAHAGTGIAHAVGATIGGFYPVEHGKIVGIVLPEAIRYNIPVAKDLYAEVAEMIGLEVKGLSAEEASNCLLEQVQSWITDFHLGASLRELGVERTKFDAMIEDTSTQNSVGNNIRPVDKDAVRKFYEILY